MKFISIGKVVGEYGLDGLIKIKPNTSYPELFFEMEYLLLTENNQVKRSLKVLNIKDHNGLIVAELSGVTCQQDAAKLKGLSVSITEDMLPKADDDEVYWFEIENLPVYNKEKVELGKLVDVLEAGSSDIFRIALNDGRYALISNNKNHVLEINTDEKFIKISELGLVYEDI